MTVEPRRNQLLVSTVFVSFVSSWFLLADRLSCDTVGEYRTPGDRGHGNEGTKSAFADSGVDAGRLGALVAPGARPRCFAAPASVARCAAASRVSLVKTP